MLTQKKIGGPETLLKLYVAIDEDLKALRPQFAGQTVAPWSARREPAAEYNGGAHHLGLGTWRGLQGQANLSFTCIGETWVPLVAQSIKQSFLACL